MQLGKKINLKGGMGWEDWVVCVTQEEKAKEICQIIKYKEFVITPTTLFVYVNNYFLITWAADKIVKNYMTFRTLKYWLWNYCKLFRILENNLILKLE